MIAALRKCRWPSGASLALAFSLALSLTLTAIAQNHEAFAPDQLSGVLKKIKDHGAIRLGYREHALPFSFLGARGQPAGYAIDLCKAIVAEAASELGIAEIRLDYRPVTPENRFTLLRSGEIDLECGSTTDTVQRREQAAFSPTIFLTGTKLLVKRDGPIKTLRDLRGRKVAVTRGTTNAAAIQAFSDRQRLDLTLIAAADHQDAFNLLAAGQAEALVNDEVLLYGLLAETRSSAQYRLLSDFLSYEPYGLMYRKDDPQFAQVVDRTFRKLAESREILWIYDRWFLKRLPSGIRLNLPMSGQLRELFGMLGLPMN